MHELFSILPQLSPRAKLRATLNTQAFPIYLFWWIRSFYKDFLNRKSGAETGQANFEMLKYC